MRRHLSVFSAHSGEYFGFLDYERDNARRLLMSGEVPSLLIYEYPSLAGPPVGTYELQGEALQAVQTLQAQGATCAGMLAAQDEEEAWAMVGMVWCYPTRYGPLHVLTQFADLSAWLKPREVATRLLKDGTYFLEATGDPAWLEFWDVALWFQYEADTGLPFLVYALAERFLSCEQQGRAWRLGQCLWPAVERNSRERRQAARRAFRKALPTLLPGLQIAKKKPGYGWKKGRADFFLSDAGRLCPAQFVLTKVAQSQITSLRQAMEAYQSPRGYLIAPGLEPEAALDENMVWVPFGR